MPTVKVRNATNDGWVAIAWGTDDGSGEGLPDLRNEPYVVLGASTVLTAERVLTAGSGITLVDGGAGGALTISAASGGTPFVDLPFIMRVPTPELTFERYLAVVGGLTLVDGGVGGPLTITPNWAAPASPSVDLAASAIGTANSFAHSDHTHQLDQAIVPTWTSLHIFNAAGAAVVKAIVRGIAAQSANLQEWQDSAEAVLVQVEPDGEIAILVDSKALKLGAGSDMSVYYDGTDGHVKTDVVAPSDLKVTCGAAKTLELQTAVYEDLFMPLAGAKVPATHTPSWVPFSTNLNSYTFAIDDYADLATTEVLHGYKEGTDLELHVHFITNGANDATARKVQYQAFFSWGDMDEVMGAEDNLSAEADIPAFEADRTHRYLELGSVTGTNYRMGSIIKVRIKRIACTGTEPDDDPFVEMVGIHFHKNTLGSRQEFVK